jgi:hypothetical protein
MADWRLAVEKVLKPAKPREIRRFGIIQAADHSRVIEQERNFSADEVIGIYPGRNRINSPAKVRIDTEVQHGARFDPVYPVYPSVSIEAASKILTPTYSSPLRYVDPVSDSNSHFSFHTHREEQDKPDKSPPGPAADDLAAWHAWMHSRIPVWLGHGLRAHEISDIVWSEAENAWNLRHHATADPDRCAGCGEWMLDGPGMRLLDGAVIHFGNPDRLDCLALYGETWRSAASAALVTLGLKRPQLTEPEGTAP